jgi:chorismate synthase
MTRKTKTKKEVRSKTVVDEVEREVVQEEEVEVPGTVCNICDQWYADDEDVEVTEWVEEPTVQTERHMNIHQLQEYIHAVRVADSVGNRVQEVVELNTVKGMWQATKEYVESRGRVRAQDIMAASAGYRNGRIGRGNVLFSLNIDGEVSGEAIHICEYCRSNL